MMKYLRNPFILIGSAGLIYYVWQRNKIMKALPKSTKSIPEMEATENLVDEDSDLPEEFIKEVDGMSKEEVVKTIEHNAKMMDRARMSEKKREGIKRMLGYLKKVYDER